MVKYVHMFNLVIHYIAIAIKFMDLNLQVSGHVYSSLFVCC